ncbi:MAG: hypothetical protein ACTTIX_00930 [Peptoanaerobacter stomatis]
MKKRKGASLFWVIIALVFTTIMTISISTVTRSNIRQAKIQDDGLQVYYIARSGAELAYEALLTSSPSLINKFKNGAISKLDEKNISVGKGKADIKVTSYTVDAVKKIKIESTGKLNNTTKTIYLEFEADNYGSMKWTY